MPISKRAMQIFEAALTQPVGERDGFIRASCGEDTGLQREVDTLLRVDQQTVAPLDAPGAGIELLAAEIARVDDVRAVPPRPAGEQIVHLQSNEYRILGVLGEGGMGTVYEAEQMRPRRTVALKVIRRGLASPQLLRRLEHEASVLARLQHPGIAQLYDAGGLDGANPDRAFIVMELVRGISLTEFAQSRGLGLRDRMELMIRVCDAVQHAHQRGVIHRDLKPANILVADERAAPGASGATAAIRAEAPTGGAASTARRPGQGAGAAASRLEPAVAGKPDPGAGAPPSSTTRRGAESTVFDPTGRGGASRHTEGVPRPKILDFGIARVLDADRNVTTLHGRSGQLVGTLAYMSPEQVRGDPADVDTRSDIYALGVILYQLTTGVLPFRFDTRALPEVARMIAEDEPPRPSQHNRALAGEIETIILKAMEKDKSRRYASAAELAADMQRFLNNEPLIARPATTFYHLRKFAARNKPLAFATLGVFLALLLGVVGMTRQTIIATDQRNRAIAAELEQSRQRERAEFAERVARTEAEATRVQALKTQRLNAFLRDMLLAATPEITAGAVVTVRDMIDAAERTLHASLSDQPDLEAEVREYFSETYRGLGALEPAETLARQALELRRVANGPASAESAWAEYLLANALFTRRQTRAANEILQRAQTQLEGDGTFDRRRLAQVLMLRVEVETRIGNMWPAEMIAYDVLEFHRREFGEQSHQVVNSLNQVARVKLTQFSTSEAEYYFREALRIAQAMHPRDHPRLATLKNNLALCYYERAARVPEASAYAREALEIARRVYPPTNPELARIVANRADTLLTMGQLDEAERLARESLAIRRQAYPPMSLPICDSLTLVASILALTDDTACLDEAELLIAEAIFNNYSSGATVFWFVPYLDSCQAECLIRRGRYAEAEPMLLQSYADMLRSRGEVDRRTQRVARRLALLYERIGRPDWADYYCSKTDGNW